MDRNRNPRSNTTLTEFAPLSPEANEPGIGFQLLSKFFSFNKDVPSTLGTAPSTASSHSSTPIDIMSSRRGSNESIQSTSSNVSTFPVNISEGRSLPNVLKRISNILALKSNNLQAYKDTHFKQYWMPDSVSRECYDCEEKFTTFRRRHHCRVCGQIFCSRCCNQEIPGKIMGCTGDLRVCTYCCKVVLSYLQSADTDAALSSDLRALQEDLQTKFGIDPPLPNASPPGSAGGSTVDVGDNVSARRKLSVGFQEDKFALGRAQGRAGFLSMEERCRALHKSASLRTLFEDLLQPGTGLALQTHRFRLRNHQRCFQGSELVDWLITQARAANRLQGCAIGQALLEAGHLEPIAERGGFTDGYTLYRPRELALPSPTATTASAQSSQEANEPLWVEQIPQQEPAIDTDSECESALTPSRKHSVGSSLPSSSSASSSFYLDMNVGENTVLVTRPQPPDPGPAPASSAAPSAGTPSPMHVGMPNELLLVQSAQNREKVPAAGWHKAANLRTDNGELQAYSRLGADYETHEAGLCKQLLNAHGLAQSWLDVVVPVCRQIVDTVRPDVRNEAGEMDIRNYVQFKKVPGGLRSDSYILSGVACTKNVAHRAMAATLKDPRILLLGCSVVYQRVEGKLLTIERIMLQEHEYLRHVVQRIAALQPDLVLVQRAVSRLAQEFLLALGVTLALHVKASVLARVARLTGADIATSVDAHIGRPRLGTCRNFYLRSYPANKGFAGKTLMFFEGCTFPKLGCTLLLRGGTPGELSRVKRVARHMLLARYNWRLEKSFLMDEFALPPAPPSNAFFDEDTSRPLPGERSLPPSPEACKSPLPPPLRQSTPVARDNSPSPSLYISAVGNSFILVDDAADKADDKAIKADDRADDVSVSGDGKRGKDEKDVSTKAQEEHEESEDSLFLDAVAGEEKAKPCLAKVSVTREDSRAGTQTVQDFSDPLHLYLNGDDEVFIAGHQGAGQSMAVSELPTSNRFRKAMDDAILSVSPYLKFSVPFLETEAGRNCTLRRYFPADVFSSAQFDERPPDGATDLSNGVHVDAASPGAKLLPEHPFVGSKLTQPVGSESIQTLLADFRACGGRVPHVVPGNAAAQLRSISVCEEPKELPTAATATTAKETKAPAKDALDAANHQKLAVLFCSYSHHSNNAPAFCVSPWVVHMDFYGRNDIPLGSFLERYCFRHAYACPSESCETPMLDHIRRFVHEAGCVHIAMRRLDRPVAEGNHILLWSWCSRCQQASPVVPMSSDTWALSLAKYLELRFHGHAYTLRGASATSPPCTHSLHHDHYQYFAFKDVIASFKYASVAVWEISLPPPLIKTLYDPTQRGSIIEDIKKLALQGYDLYSNVLEKLCALGNELDGIAAMKSQRTQEHAILKSCIEEVQLKLTSPKLDTIRTSSALDAREPDEGVQQLLWRIEDSVVHLKLHIADAVCSWNARIQEAMQGRRREDKAASRKSTDSVLSRTTTSTASLSLDGDNATLQGVVGISSPRLAEEVRTETVADEEVEPLDPQPPISPTASIGVADGSTQYPHLLHAAPSETPPSQSEPVVEMARLVPGETSGQDLLAGPADDAAEGSKHSPAPPERKSVKTIIMSQLRSSGTPFTPIQCPLSPQEHRLPDVAGCLVPTLVYESEPSSIISYALSSLDYRRALDDLRAKKFPSAEPPAASPLTKRKSGTSLIEKLDSSSDLTQSVESRKSAVLSFLRGTASAGASPARTGSTDGSQPSVPSSTAADAIAPEGPEDARGDGPGKPSKPCHHLYIEVQFSDANTNFFCRVYFAQPFAALRQMVLPSGEEAYVRSLARCVRWAARGGKSGSAFCKTKDDRFILKEMPRQELQLFLEFAPHYFGYVMRCHAAKQPTLLGKIVGVYRVVFRNAATNAALKSNLLVMENLFYARSVTHKFDLKGSVRNRLVNPAEDHIGEIVLLDENLLKMTCDSPLYMLPHSKSVLSQAIDNDTQFLAGQEVMDYSLLVGLDQDRRELVVGIIDYIRTFTWDKKLETMVKSSGILGGQGKMPTVVSPELYRARFIASMHQYFLPVPDRWAGLGKQLD